MDRVHCRFICMHVDRYNIEVFIVRITKEVIHMYIYINITTIIYLTHLLHECLLSKCMLYHLKIRR